MGKVVKLAIPGREVLEIHNLILDMNGTLTTDGLLGEGTPARIQRLKSKLKLYLVTADTFGTGAGVARELGIDLVTVSPDKGAADKADFAVALGTAGLAAIGNGYNDVELFKQARLSIAVIGREGCCVTALLNADIAVNSINDALDLLLEPLRLTATLRS